MAKQIFKVGKISQAVDDARVPLNAITRAGDLIFQSGIPAIDQKTGEIITGDITRQTEMALENMKTCLEAAGSSMDKVLMTKVWITNVAYFGKVNEVYRRFWPKDPPARTFVNVQSWPWEFDIEIECIACA